MSEITIGVDNGSSGTVGVITPSYSVFLPIPTKPCLHYGKAGTVSQRLDWGGFWNIFNALPLTTSVPRILLERPFTGSPMMIKSMLSAHRFFEATICFLEVHNFGYEVIDSGTWQKPLLGKVKGSAALKEASRLRGIQLYPQHADAINKHGDADGLLIAHHFHYGNRNP